MFFPLHTDRRMRHTPWMNYSLIGLNVAIFLLTLQPAWAAWKEQFILDPMLPGLWHQIPYQFITYQFLHAGWEHLLGNMLFLYVFGNSVEDRLGKVGYLAFYLAGGVLAGLGHALLATNPVLGASGSICAVTGAYLALSPLSNVTIFYWLFIFIGTFEISSIYLILFQIAENVFMQLTGSGQVAYLAHLAGYTYGFVVGLALLFARLLPREPYDMLAMIEQRRRRAMFNAAVRQGYQPWEARAPGSAPISGGGSKAAPVSPEQEQIMRLRAEIAAALNSRDLTEAAETYARLLNLSPGQVMGQQQQLDLANQLASEGRYALAAQAYELFLQIYKTYPDRQQVELMLGLIYARYLQQRDKAVNLLNAALSRLSDATQRDLARQVLAEMG